MRGKIIKTQKRMPEIHLKIKRLYYFLYRKAIKKQFAMWIEECIFIEHIFPFDTHRDQCLKSAFDFFSLLLIFPPLRYITVCLCSFLSS